MHYINLERIDDQTQKECNDNFPIIDKSRDLLTDKH